MKSVGKTTTKKPAKTAVKAVSCKVVCTSSGSALRGNMLTGQALSTTCRHLAAKWPPTRPWRKICS